MPGYDGSIRIDTRIDGKGFNAGMKAIIGSVGKVAAAVGVAFGVGAVVAFGKTAVDAASQLASAMTGLQSVLNGTGKSFTGAQKFINDYIKDGLIPATNAINAYKNLALRGYDDSQIQQTLTALKDASAFGRQASLTMGEAVQSASEGLKNENSILVDNAGVTKNVAQMWKDYADSIGASVNNLTKQQKIQAEVAGIMEESKYQTGDAATLAGGFAGQVAALGTSLYNLKVAVGNAIIPIWSKVIAAIKPVIDWLVVLFNKLAQVMSLLFNVQIGASTAGMEGVADSTQDAADATGNLADNTNKANKAAKGALAAFDELNVLQQDTGSAGAGGGGGTAGGGSGVKVGEDILPEDSALAAKVEEIKAKFAELTEPLRAPFERLKTSLAGLGGTIWDGLKWAWDNILVPLGKWVITDALPVFMDLLASGADVLNEALIALQPMGVWLWEEFLKPAAEWVGQALLDGLQWLTDRLNDLAAWIHNNQKTVETIAIVIGSFAAAWWLVNAAVTVWAAIGAIATGVTAAFGAAVAFLTSPIFLVALAIAALIAIVILLIKNWDWVKETAGKVWEWIKGVWAVAWEWFKTKVVDPIVNIFRPFWDLIRILANDAWVVIQYIWSVVSAWFKANVIDPVSQWFSEAWENIKGFFSDAWDKVKAIWEVVSTWFQTTVVDPIKSAFETALDAVKEKWETIFGGIRDFAKTIINSIIGFINGLLSGMASGINGLINGANTLGGKLPGWITIPNVVAPQIPLLAKGAVIPPNAEFLAVLGDQKSGRNIEAPEDLIRQIVREEVGSQPPQQVNINFGGSMSELVRVLKPYIDKENTRVGFSLISGGVIS